jgi:hypothetical protein
MRTQKQIEAARRNGAKSRGPVTPEGKARSAQNRRTHGLSGSVVVLQNEATDAFQALLDSYLELHQPANAAEANLVMHIASAQWRLQRCVSMETAALDHQMDRQRVEIDEKYAIMDEPTRTMLAFTALAETSSSGLTALHRYETRLQRIARHATAELLRLQAARREAEAQRSAPQHEPHAADGPPHEPENPAAAEAVPLPAQLAAEKKRRFEPGGAQPSLEHRVAAPDRDNDGLKEAA